MPNVTNICGFASYLHSTDSARPIGASKCLLGNPSRKLIKRNEVSKILNAASAFFHCDKVHIKLKIQGLFVSFTVNAGIKIFIFSGLINLQQYRLYIWQIKWQYVPIRCQRNDMFHAEFLGNLRLCYRWSGGCEGHNLAHWGKTLQQLQCQKSRMKVWLSPWHNTVGLVYHNMFHIQSSEIILYQWLCKILRMPHHKSWRHGCGLVISFQTCDEVTINNSRP